MGDYPVLSVWQAVKIESYPSNILGPRFIKAVVAFSFFDDVLKKFANKLEGLQSRFL